MIRDGGLFAPIAKGIAMNEKTGQQLQEALFLQKLVSAGRSAADQRLEDNSRARKNKADWYAPCPCGSGTPAGQCCFKRPKP